MEEIEDEEKEGIDEEEVEKEQKEDKDDDDDNDDDDDDDRGIFISVALSGYQINRACQLIGNCWQCGIG